MLQLLGTQEFSTVGKPKVARSALWSFFVHTFVMLFLLSMAYWRVDTLPERLTASMLVAPLPPAPPPPPAPVIKTARAAVVRVARVYSPVLTAPVSVPQHVANIVEAMEAPELVGGVIGGVPGGIPGGVPGGIPGVIAMLPPPPPPPPPQVVVKVAPPPEPQAPARVQVDSEIQAAKLLVMIQPDYPLMAKQARIQGAVHMTAIIDREGKITEVKVLDGNPLLVEAARCAVAKWRYRPTFLHGEAVEVVTNIVVKFHLS